MPFYYVHLTRPDSVTMVQPVQPGNLKRTTKKLEAKT